MHIVDIIFVLDAQVAKHLDELGNFNGVMEILSALSFSFIKRLRNVWKEVPSKLMKGKSTPTAQIYTPIKLNASSSTHTFTHIRAHSFLFIKQP